MNNRPKTLDSSIESVFKLSPNQKIALKKMGLKTVLNLLRYFPVRYGETAEVKSIEYLAPGDDAVIFGKIKNLKLAKTFRSKVPISSGTVEDSTGNIKIVWFNQAYIAKMFEEGSLVRIEGKISNGKNGIYFSNPKIEKASKIPEGTSESLFGSKEDHNMHPTYRESRYISSSWIFHHVQEIIASGVLEQIVDPIPEIILKKYSLPSLKTSFIWIHAPRKMGDAEVARKRFAFEEMLLIQLDRQKERMLSVREKAIKIEKTKKEIDGFVKNFPFPLTGAQERCIETILKDFKQGHPMSRLLEGDVGSGKTAVAAMASFAAISTSPLGQDFGNLQVAYMAPTEILAEQHFESFIEYFKEHKINVGLITGSGARKFPSKIAREKYTKISKPQLLKWVANGEIPILIGTHALIQKNITFKNLGLIIIDEQHRFGVKQRKELRKKGGLSVDKNAITPHLLSMTATPIPRTLALTIFGDLDLSVLDELPKGRQIPETKIALSDERDEVYEKMRKEIQSGRQAYVICPRIDPAKEEAGSVASYFAPKNMRSVTEETERLQKKIFPEFKVGSITGKMTPTEKQNTMRDFKENKFQILVATSVVEVGVNVPNATVIVIENSERFGLSQLHQLRGRVLRSSHKPYCFVFAESKSEKTIERLKSFVRAKNGFELAEEDLKQRGAGDLLGAKQWGISDLAMEALKNIKMVEAAREEAKDILEKDFNLDSHKLLKDYLAYRTSAHME